MMEKEIIYGNWYQAAKHMKMSEDELADFNRLLYAWVDAHDEYVKCLGKETFNQDAVTVTAKAAAEAKLQLDEFVKGLCNRTEEKA